MRIINYNISIVLICFLVLLFCADSKNSLIKANELNQYDLSRGKLNNNLNREINKILEMDFLKNGKIDTKELRKARWKLEAIGPPAIPYLLNLIPLDKSDKLKNKLLSDLAMSTLIEIGEPVFPYLQKQPYSSYLASKKIKSEIEKLLRLKKIHSSVELDKEIEELIDELNIGGWSHIDDNGQVVFNGELINKARYAQKALKAIGVPAIPYLLSLTKNVFSADFASGFPARIALNILIEIGEPVLPYLNTPQYSESEIAQEIIKGIKEKNKVIEEIEYLKEEADKKQGS